MSQLGRLHFWLRKTEGKVLVGRNDPRSVEVLGGGKTRRREKGNVRARGGMEAAVQGGWILGWLANEA